MTIKGWKWPKTAINTGNLWTTALQPMDDDDDVQTCQNPVGFTMAELWLATGHALMDLLLMVTVYYSPTLLYRHPLNTGTHI